MIGAVWGFCLQQTLFVVMISPQIPSVVNKIGKILLGTVYTRLFIVVGASPPQNELRKPTWPYASCFLNPPGAEMGVLQEN